MDVELIDSSVWTGILRTVSPEACFLYQQEYSYTFFSLDGHCSKCCPPKKEYKKQTCMLTFLRNKLVVTFNVLFSAYWHHMMRLEHI